MKLTPKQKIFVNEYIIDLNATRAYKVAYPKVTKDETAAAAGARLLRNVKVEAYIQERMKDREKRAEITQDMVLQRWWDIATADPNEIIHLRRLCCRHCFGIDHQYQWRDEEEYQQAVQSAIAYSITEGKESKKPVLPSDAGGYGFDKLLKPHPKCPYCQGEGIPDLFVADTRGLGQKSKLLYAGIKQTQAGIEVKFRDQDKALENVARHLGMFNDNLNINASIGVQIIDDIGSGGEDSDGASADTG